MHLARQSRHHAATVARFSARIRTWHGHMQLLITIKLLRRACTLNFADLVGFSLIARRFLYQKLPESMQVKRYDTCEIRTHAGEPSRYHYLIASDRLKTTRPKCHVTCSKRSNIAESSKLRVSGEGVFDGLILCFIYARNLARNRSAVSPES